MPYYSHHVCRACPYHFEGQLALAPVNGRAHEPLIVEQRGSPILIVARAPGIDEWEDGHPLISSNFRSAAYRLRKSMERIGKQRQHFDITNVVLCYPGKPPQAPGAKSPRDNPPAPQGVSQCRYWLQEAINYGRYTKIVTLGKEAKDSVMACVRPENLTIVCVNHPSSGRLKNVDLDIALS